jgi:8-oxo-dGTP pyrophosphatase MutT (NUDIX family)
MSAAGNNGNSRLAAGWSQVSQPPATSFRLSHLRKLRGCEQVAAVCYRVNGRGIEFLLVQTRGGRWTFPKGGVEPGLTLAQTAALEAFEEAGVHGRIEETPFIRYARRRLSVDAYLCEVLRLGPPQESRRNRTWFSSEKAKRRLCEGRTPDDGAEFIRVVDRAVARIHRLGGVISRPSEATKHDALQEVHLEPFAPAGFQAGVQGAAGTSLFRFIRRQGSNMEHSASIELAVNAYLCKIFRGKVLRLNPAQPVNGNPTWSSAEKLNHIARLTSGTGAAADSLPKPKVQFIDNAREATRRTRTSATGKGDR